MQQEGRTLLLHPRYISQFSATRRYVPVVSHKKSNRKDCHN
jgi:hypothetical protein